MSSLLADHQAFGNRGVGGGFVDTTVKTEGISSMRILMAATSHRADWARTARRQAVWLAWLMPSEMGKRSRVCLRAVTHRRIDYAESGRRSSHAWWLHTEGQRKQRNSHIWVNYTQHVIVNSSRGDTISAERISHFISEWPELCRAVALKSFELTLCFLGFFFLSKSVSFTWKCKNLRHQERKPVCNSFFVTQTSQQTPTTPSLLNLFFLFFFLLL